MPAGASHNSCRVAPIFGALTLGLLCALAAAHFSDAARAEAQPAALHATFSASTAFAYGQRDLLLQEEALFDAERAGFETPASAMARSELNPMDLAPELAERALARVIQHEEALEAAVAPRQISIADLIQDLRAQYTAREPVKDALARGAAPVVAPGGAVSLFAPAAASPAPDLRPRASAAAPAAWPAAGLALQNYYSIRNGYAGRTVETLYLLSPPASAALLPIAPSSPSFFTLLDFTTAHNHAPEIPV